MFRIVIKVEIPGPILLTWIIFNPSMGKKNHMPHQNKIT